MRLCSARVSRLGGPYSHLSMRSGASWLNLPRDTTWLKLPTTWGRQPKPLSTVVMYGSC